MTNIGREIARLRTMSPKELRARYAEVFGEPTRSGNKPQLIKKIAWRIQANAEGGLSERAKRRAEQLARDSDIRLTPPPQNGNGAARTRTAPLRTTGDDRLPPPGSVITREYRGQTLEVTVLERGFEHEGETYRTLSAVAKAITGSHCNGFLFFRLGKYAR